MCIILIVYLMRIFFIFYSLIWYKGLWYTLYMADKTPVQDKLSKLLAELMWCLSGTEEEDEYAGQVYLQMDNMDNDGEGVWDDEEEDEEGDDMSDDDDVPVIGVDPQAERELFANNVVEDDEGDTMEIIDMDDSDEENNNDMEDSEDVEEEDEDEERIKAMNESHCRGAHLVSLYVSTFLRTVRREWGNVDKHRVDKFYTAVRYMIGEVRHTCECCAYDMHIMCLTYFLCAQNSSIMMPTKHIH